MESNAEYSVDNSRKREDLIGRKGHITKTIEVIDAKETIVGGVAQVDIRVIDGSGEEYWTSLDEDVFLD